MIEFIVASENLPFSVALAIVFGIALLEGITSLFGAGLSGLLETLLPDLKVGVDTDERKIRRIPILMRLIIFLTAFGLIGFGAQSTAYHIIATLLPAWLASIPAIVIALLILKVMGGLLERLIPTNETEAVSEKSFIGRIAIVTLGTATKGSAAQAKLKDEYGYPHYIMVEPDTDREAFKQGDEVLLIQQDGSVFQAIINKNEILTDTQQ